MNLLEAIDNLLIEKNLYHGTIKDHRRSIERRGLIPDVGDFVKDAYPDYRDGELDAVVFAADNAQFRGAANALQTHVAKKLGKRFHDVTEEDVRKHGLLAVFRDDSQFEFFDPDDVYGPEIERHPRQAEPGDYYARYSVDPDFMLVGNKLVNFLRDRGRVFKGARGSEDWEKKTREELIRRMVEVHKKKGDDERRIRRQAVEYVKKLPKDRLQKVLEKYRADHDPEKFWDIKKRMKPKWKLDQ